MNKNIFRSTRPIFGILALLISSSFGQSNPDNVDPPSSADPTFSDFKVGQRVLDTASNTIEVNYYTDGELYRILPRQDGVYRFYGELTVTSGLDNVLMSLEGISGKVPTEAPANSTIHFFEFTRSAFEFGDHNLQLTIRNRVTKKLLKAIPLSWSADFGINQGGSFPGEFLSSTPESENDYKEQKCETCKYSHATEEIKTKKGTEDTCAFGQTVQEPTNEKRVNSMTSAGQSHNGRSPASMDHSVSDLSNPSSGSASMLNPRTGANAQVTMASGGSYPEKITTDTGTLRVTTATGGYDMAAYQKSDTSYTNPQTELCVRRVVSGSAPNLVYKLRFIEKRFGTSIIECRYEQAVDAYKVSGVTRGDIWTLYEGAELSSKTAAEAPDSAFLRKTVTEVDDIESSEIITTYERAATSGLWVIVSKVKNFYGSEINGGPITKAIIDFGGAARERTWSHYPITEINKYAAGLPLNYVEHTGGKVNTYYNTSNGFPTSTYSTFAGNLTGRQHVFSFNGGGYDAKIEEKVSGQAVSSLYLISSEDSTTKTVIRERSPSSGATVGAAGALRTTVTRYKTSAGEESNLVKKVVNEDNTYMLYEYASIPVDNPWISTTTQVPKVTITVKEFGSDDIVWTEMETDYICGIRKEVRKYTHDLQSYSASRVHLKTTSFSNLDGLARPLTTTVSFPTSSSSVDQIFTRVIGCCGLKQTTDYRGIVKVYHYDHLRRLETVEQGGVVEMTIYNGLEIQTGRAPADPALQDSHGHYTSRGANLGFLMSNYRKVNLLGNTTQTRVPSKRTASGYETNNHLFTYYTDVVRERIKKPDGQFYYYRYHHDGKFMRQNGTGSYWIKMFYGPSISGLTYPAGAVNATQEDFNNGRWNATFYNNLGQVIENTNAHGATTTFEYNSLGQLTKTTSPDGVVMLYLYNNRGERIKSAVDLNGVAGIQDDADRVTWNESYYALSDNRYGIVSESSAATVEASAAQKVLGYSWSSMDGLHSFQQPLNNTNLKSTSTTTLGVSGNWTITATAASGNVTTSTYTTGYRTSRVSTGAGETLSSISYGYDDYRRVETETDARTDQTAYTIAAAGNVLTATLERGAGTGDDIKTTYVYDNMGRLTETVDANSKSTYRDYDVKGRLTAIWGENTYARAYAYNSSFEMIVMHTFKDDSVFNSTTPPTTSSPNFEKTEWIYESASGYLLEKKDADLKSLKYTYSIGGRLLTRTSARGIRTRYYYDSVGQLTDTHYFATVAADNGNPDPGLNVGNEANTEDLSYEYDRLGRLKNVRRDGTLHANYAYSAASLLQITENLNQDTAVAKSLHRYYDPKLRPRLVAMSALGSLDDTSNPAQHAYSYEYDGAGRLEIVTHAPTVNESGVSTGGEDFTYDYVNNAGSLVKTLTGPAHTVTNTWMAYRNILKIRENRLGVTNYSTYNYGEYVDNGMVKGGINEIGQRTSVIQSGDAFGGDQTLNWTYNVRGEIDAETHTDSNRDNAYQFDGIGNRKKTAFGTVTLPSSDNYVANNVNEYTTVPGSIATAHDDDGNLINGPVPGDRANSSSSTTTANTPSNATNLVWDAENRLVRLDLGLNTITYEYDYLGRLIAKIGGVRQTQTENYCYDGWNLIALSNGTTNPPKHIFTWGLDLSGTTQGAGGVGGLLATSYDGHGDVYPLYDGNGNVCQYLNNGANPLYSGTFVARWDYDAFGRTVKGSADPLTTLMLHRFSTKQTDYDTGLHYYGYRWYNSYTGRWPSRDPIGEEGGINLYGMVGNDAVNKWDLLGLKILFKNRPCLNALDVGYPGYDTKLDPDAVYKDCGGDVQKFRKQMGEKLDSCSLRVCQALNSTNVKVKPDGKGRYRKDKNGNWNLLGADELKNNLTRQWGRADLIILELDNKAEEALKGKCAIVFQTSIKGYAGHAGLVKNGVWHRQKDVGVPPGPIYVWFVPCKCEKEKKIICETCKKSS